VRDLRQDTEQGQQQSQQDAARGVESTRRVDPGRGEALYVRPMPGGGTVRVELQVEHRDDRSRARRRGRVVMDSRDPRAGAEPTVLEEMEGYDENVIVDTLFRIARDNAAIARRLLKQQTTAQRAD
jgi:hypothetical protein